MAGSLITLNISAIKVNNMLNPNFVAGEVIKADVQSQLINFTAGSFNTGDLCPMINPTEPFFNDPDVTDNSSPETNTIS